MWPQITLIVLFAITLGIYAARNGEPRTAYSFPVYVFSIILHLSLLYFGGFFSVFGV